MAIIKQLNYERFGQSEIIAVLTDDDEIRMARKAVECSIAYAYAIVPNDNKELMKLIYKNLQKEHSTDIEFMNMLFARTFAGEKDCE